MNRIFLLLLSLSLFGCMKSEKGLKVAANAVPHAQMLEEIKPDLAAQGINLVIIVTNDYNMPNLALVHHEIDANFFQHLPFLEEQIARFNYPIEDFANIEIEPMGIYSKKVTSLNDLRDHAVITIPNDPTNESRALHLLQKGGVIQLNTDSLSATPANISWNPKKIKFVEIDSAMLPRSLHDVDAAAINTNYALEADLLPQKDALVVEDADSPYVNVLVIRTADKDRADLQALKAALTSEKMRAFIKKEYKGAIIPAF
jgi:D-methionine transport system substrate-binding protein